MYYQIFPGIIFTLITPLADTGIYLIYIWEDKIMIIILAWIEEYSDSRIKEMAKQISGNKLIQITCDDHIFANDLSHWSAAAAVEGISQIK